MTEKQSFRRQERATPYRRLSLWCLSGALALGLPTLVGCDDEKAALPHESSAVAAPSVASDPTSEMMELEPATQEIEVSMAISAETPTIDEKLTPTEHARITQIAADTALDWLADAKAAEGEVSVLTHGDSLRVLGHTATDVREPELRLPLSGAIGDEADLVVDVTRLIDGGTRVKLNRIAGQHCVDEAGQFIGCSEGAGEYDSTLIFVSAKDYDGVSGGLTLGDTQELLEDPELRLAGVEHRQQKDDKTQDTMAVTFDRDGIVKGRSTSGPDYDRVRQHIERIINGQ